MVADRMIAVLVSHAN